MAQSCDLGVSMTAHPFEATTMVLSARDIRNSQINDMRRSSLVTSGDRRFNVEPGSTDNLFLTITEFNSSLFKRSVTSRAAILESPRSMQPIIVLEHAPNSRNSGIGGIS